MGAAGSLPDSYPLDSAGVPLPASVDALLITVGALNPKMAYVAVLLGITGSVVGNLFLFSVARKGGEAYLARHTISARGKKLRQWFQHYGLITVFITDHRSDCPPFQ